MNPGTLVIPLDGSDVAEAALPYAEAIARATGADLRLLAVVEPEPRGLTSRSERVATAIEGAARGKLEQRLAAVAAALRGQGLTVATAVVVGEPVDRILATAEEAGVSMIIMATHGRGGLDRWAIGSVADKVMRLGTRPTLLVRPPYMPAPRRPVILARLLLPLDGSPLAEAALTPATELAAALGAGLTLIRIEPWRTEGLAPPGMVSEFTQREEEAGAAAEAYLAGVRSRIPAGIPVETVVLRGRPATTLVDFALHERVDLVVMTTHGWGGLRRLVLGSTADRIVRTGVPALLVRP